MEGHESRGVRASTQGDSHEQSGDEVEDGGGGAGGSRRRNGVRLDLSCFDRSLVQGDLSMSVSHGGAQLPEGGIEGGSALCAQGEALIAERETVIGTQFSSHSMADHTHTATPTPTHPLTHTHTHTTTTHHNSTNHHSTTRFSNHEAQLSIHEGMVGGGRDGGGGGGGTGVGGEGGGTMRRGRLVKIVRGCGSAGRAWRVLRTLRFISLSLSLSC